jgi:hypothetical protein
MIDKERLGEIKERFAKYEYDYNLNGEDVEWLINRVEELEEGVKEAVSDIENISPHEAKKTLMDLIKNMEGET